MVRGGGIGDSVHSISSVQVELEGPRRRFVGAHRSTCKHWCDCMVVWRRGSKESVQVLGDFTRNWIHKPGISRKHLGTHSEIKNGLSVKAEIKRKIGSILLYGVVFAPTLFGVYIEERRPQISEASSPDAEELLATLVQVALESRIVADERGMILYASKSAAEALGYKPSELNNKPTTTIIPERYRQRHTEAYIAAMNRAIKDIRLPDGRRQEDAPMHKDLNALAKDGTERPFKLTARIRQAGDRHLGVLQMIPAESSPAAKEGVP